MNGFFADCGLFSSFSGAATTCVSAGLSATAVKGGFANTGERNRALTGGSVRALTGGSVKTGLSKAEQKLGLYPVSARDAGVSS